MARNDYEELIEARKRRIIKIFSFSLIGILCLIIIFGSFYTIGAGERGVLLTFGKPSMDAKSEGLHFKFPLIQKIVKMDVKTQKYEADLTAASRDLQDVATKIAINYHILPETVPEIYRDIGVGYAEKVIYPYEQETNKAITSQFTAEELITKRDSVRERMKTELKDKLQSRGIVIEEISIINFAFSPSFTTAIEAKVTAEQLKLKADRDLERIKVEAEQKIASAKAEAEALRLQKLEITPDLIKLRQIEVQRQAIEKWNGILPQVTGGAIPFIEIQQILTQS